MQLKKEAKTKKLNRLEFLITYHKHNVVSGDEMEAPAAVKYLMVVWGWERETVVNEGEEGDISLFNALVYYY